MRNTGLSTVFLDMGAGIEERRGILPGKRDASVECLEVTKMPTFRRVGIFAVAFPVV